MPITKSAKKALRQNARRKVANTKRKDAYKSAVKDLRKAISAKGDGAKEILAKTMKALDKAAKTNAIKKANIKLDPYQPNEEDNGSERVPD